MKYSVSISGIGAEALDLLEHTNALIIYDDDAPAELQEIAVVHTPSPVHAMPEVGDMVMLCGKEFYISAIGEKALDTLEALGHCTLCFEGGDTPKLPGYIMLDGEAFAPGDVQVGAKIEIV